jgi:hypothetical protein
MPRKRPAKQSAPAELGKRPRGGAIADNVPQSLFRWRVRRADWDGQWGWHTADARVILLEVVSKLHDYETMKWAEIEGDRNHFVALDHICGDAQRRLRELGLEDEVEALFSLHLTGPKRVWGIRDGAVLHVLWWDPDHTVCPSIKRNT